MQTRIILILFLLVALGQECIARDLSLTEARRLKGASSLPAPALSALNKMINSNAWKNTLRISFSRMRSFEPIIIPQLKSKHIPLILRLIPVLESNYTNPPADHPTGAAGLWQLMPETARGQGLQVEGDIDERLDVQKSTAVAARLLAEAKRHFKTWPMAVLAYGEGEGHMSRAIKKIGSDDPWTLIEAGCERNQGHLAKLLAVIIIFQNQELIL